MVITSKPKRKPDAWGKLLYAVVVKVKGGFEFRAPHRKTLKRFDEAEKTLATKTPQWDC